MDSANEDRFIVFVREDDQLSGRPERVERELVSCSTYEEARWVRQEYSSSHRKCIIRFVGPAGGGD